MLSFVKKTKQIRIRSLFEFFFSFQCFFQTDQITCVVEYTYIKAYILVHEFDLAAVYGTKIETVSERVRMMSCLLIHTFPYGECLLF